MKKLIDILDNPSQDSWAGLLERPAARAEDLEELVTMVFEQVRIDGNAALRKFTQQFDQVWIKDPLVPKEEFAAARNLVAQDLKKAMALAKANIEKFHASQRGEIRRIETYPGVWCWQEKKPVEKVGLYIPGGTAPLFSTVLMLAVPAKLAGCREIILCTPPNKDGFVSPAILYAAELCGVSTVYKVGGVQAIAAMTFGAGSIPKVDKIFGPGNQFVTAAKQMALKIGVAIDIPAGPSELLILADDSSSPEFVAADLLSQAEHGEDSQVVLVSSSKPLLDRVQRELEKQLEALPRKTIAEAALQHSKGIYLEKRQQILDLVNEYGPEHLIICTENPEFFSKGVVNAGSVFLGRYSPESAGDYASGTNHTLPTGGYAKQYSGVNLDSFLKAITFQEISGKGLQGIGSAIETMAAAEGLEGHKNAVKIRLNEINGESK